MKEFADALRVIDDTFLIIKNNHEKSLAHLSFLENEKSAILKSLDLRVKAIDYVEQVASEERKDVKQRIEELITHCLHEVYDESYSIEFRYGVKASKTAVEIILVRKCPDGLVVQRDIEGFGGGVADTISLPLKIVVLLNDNEFSRILIADEPGKHLDQQRVEKFARFLKVVVKKLAIQMIMSSHHVCMDSYADSINYVTLEGSTSKVEKIK